MPAAVSARPRPSAGPPSGGLRRRSGRGRPEWSVAPPRRRLTWKRALLVPLAVFLGWVGWSYMRALNAPGNDAVAIRTTEWLKNHHFTWAINDIERYWYEHHQPKKGGAPKGALGSTLQPSSGSRVSAPPEVPHLPLPPPIPPFVSAPTAGEGQWKPLGTPVHGVPAMYAAFLRPDAVHTSLVTGVVWMDPLLIKAVGYAGVVEPGGGPWSHEAPIAPSVRPDLL